MKPVKAETIPAFQERAPGGMSLQRQTVLNMGLLAVLNLVLFAACYLSFERYDVC
jgi:hypothetical protein